MGSLIQQAFTAARKANRIGLIPFIPAGYSDLATTAAALIACDRSGATVIEVGFPFSDPIADGPTIQEAFTAALAKKLKIADVFAAVKSISPKLSTPLVAMVSYSIVFRYGTEKFLADAKAAGFAGLIVPDLPPPEAEKVARLVHAAGLDNILLIAPTTSAARRLEIVKQCSGFVYYLSVSGITGERDRLPDDLTEAVRQIKALTDLPVCIGFGIHKPAQVAELAKVADGAIVGTAIVRRIKEHAAEGPAAIAEVIGEYLKSLVGQK